MFEKIKWPMTTLFDATFRLAGFMVPLWESDATAQANNSLTDALAAFSADQVGRTLWMLTGSLAGTSIKVTSKTSATALAFATQAANIAVGDHYALSNSDYPIGNLRRAVNEAVRIFSQNITEDDTLETVAEQEEYGLPEGVRNVQKVWKAESLTAPYQYKRLYHWDEVEGELRFPTAYAPAVDDYKLKIEYLAPHEDLTDDSDELRADLNLDLIHWQAAVWICRDGTSRFHGDPKRDLTNKMNEAQAHLAQLKRNWHPKKRDARPSDY